MQNTILLLLGQKKPDQHGGGDASANSPSGFSGSATSLGKKY